MLRMSSGSISRVQVTRMAGGGRRCSSGSRYRARVSAIPASRHWNIQTDSHPPAPGTGPGSGRSPPPDTEIHRQTVTLRLQVQGPGQGDPRLPTLEYTDRQTDRQSTSGSRYRARVRAIPASRHWNTQTVTLRLQVQGPGQRDPRLPTLDYTDRQTDSHPPAPGTGPGSGRSPPPDTGIHRQTDGY